MADSIALQVLDELISRVRKIEISSGYNTDIGKDAELGKRNPTPMEGILNNHAFVFDISETDDEELSNICGGYGVALECKVEVYASYLDDDAIRVIHRMAQDIKRSVFLATDRTMGGLVADVVKGDRLVAYPEPGGETVAVQQTVIVRYIEPYGNP